VNQRNLLWLIFAVQAVSAAFFLSDTLASIFGLRSRPINWQLRELLEIGAVIGLLLGTVLGVVAIARSQRRTEHLESQLRVAAGAFAELLDERFVEWGLTPAERDVAVFAVKGMSISEIAALRETSEGTVKAQSNAIYRKAGVTGRYQLLSLFVDELMTGISDTVGTDTAGGSGTKSPDAP